MERLFGHLQHWKFSKVGPKFSQVPRKTLKKAEVEKFCQILSHCLKIIFLQICVCINCKADLLPIQLLFLLEGIL